MAIGKWNGKRCVCNTADYIELDGGKIDIREIIKQHSKEITLRLYRM